MMLTYHADILPRALVNDRGVYIMDAHRNFSALVAVYDSKTKLFTGLHKDYLVTEPHVGDGGVARPIMEVAICPFSNLSPYEVFEDQLEGQQPAKVSINNWDLFVFLEEYEDAYIKGAFDAR